MFTNSDEKTLDQIDHIAVQVQDIEETVRWYSERFNCAVSYKDETWALLKFGNISLAFVVKSQHPPHIGISRDDASVFGKLKPHRDGTESCYIQDPSENYIEVVKSPKN